MSCRHSNSSRQAIDDVTNMNARAGRVPAVSSATELPIRNRFRDEQRDKTSICSLSQLNKNSGQLVYFEQTHRHAENTHAHVLFFRPDA